MSVPVRECDRAAGAGQAGLTAPDHAARGSGVGEGGVAAADGGPVPGAVPAAQPASAPPGREVKAARGGGPLDEKVLWAAEARVLNLKTNTQRRIELLAEGIEARDWETLGFGSVAEWYAHVCDCEKASGEVRDRLVAALRAEGYSLRGIAAELDISKDTARRALRGAGPQPCVRADAAKVKGADGKSYPAQVSRRATPERRGAADPAPDRGAARLRRLREAAGGQLGAAPRQDVSQQARPADPPAPAPGALSPGQGRAGVGPLAAGLDAWLQAFGSFTLADLAEFAAFAGAARLAAAVDGLARCAECAAHTMISALVPGGGQRPGADGCERPPAPDREQLPQFIRGWLAAANRTAFTRDWLTAHETHDAHGQASGAGGSSGGGSWT